MQYLKFPDEATAKSATGWWSKKAGWVAPTPELQIAVRGIVYNNDGVYDTETGECITPPTMLDGFYIDVLYGEILATAQPFIITPSKPSFVLA